MSGAKSVKAEGRLGEWTEYLGEESSLNAQDGS